MPYNSRDPQADGTASASSYPISRALAMTVFAAVVILFALRHIYGSIAIEAGSH